MTGVQTCALPISYGRLYNWYAIKTGKLAPKGWHVPTDDEWKVLTDYVGGIGVEGIIGLKEAGTIHWNSPNEGGTNETGFTALPGGSSTCNNEQFNFIGNYGYWWSATEAGDGVAWFYTLYYDYSHVWRNWSHMKNGYSVRLVKD